MSELIESLLRYTGQTVTIFTESGGLSGSGFTGTLAGVYGCTVRLITCIGAPPACPIGSSCTGYPYPYYGYPGAVAAAETAAAVDVAYNGWGYYPGNGSCGATEAVAPAYYPYNNWLGSVCEIPVDKIVSFTHTAI